MYNPLTPLFPKIVEALINQGFKHFVRQSYPRGMANNIKEAFLITHYRELNEATAHFNTIKFDSRKHLYSINNEEEKTRLMKAASQPEGYRIFIALLKDRKWSPPADLDRKVETYLWRDGSGTSRKTKFTLGIQFGELMLNIESGVKTFVVPYKTIENIETL